MCQPAQKTPIAQSPWLTEESDKIPKQNGRSFGWVPKGVHRQISGINMSNKEAAVAFLQLASSGNLLETIFRAELTTFGGQSPSLATRYRPPADL
jgi:hypothetical protein